LPTLESVSDIFDKVFVIDDCSPDNQNEVVLQQAKKDPRIELLRHKINQGPGGAIITGYSESLKQGYDITVVVGGDNQMSLHEVERFLDPIVDGKVDYTKGNRFLLSHVEDTLEKMPKIRLVGNWIITALTKVASGFYKVMDVVDGYTAISKRAIDTIDWSRAWKKYGYPMDFLIRLNAYGFKVEDIPRTAVYLPGERQSQIKGFRYALKVSPMIVKAFYWRLKFRYIYLDFHPLVFFYLLGFILFPAGIISGIYLVVDKLLYGGYNITGPRTILVALVILIGLQFLLFAMLFDMEEGK